MIEFSKEDVELVEKFIEIKNKGFYCDGKQLTDAYNRILNKNVNVTNCGSCIRGRVQELEDALRAYKRRQEALNNNNPNNSPSEENKALTDEAGKQPVTKKVGRPKKN